MESSDNINFEGLLHGLGGCGCFQILAVGALSFVSTVVGSTMYFMTYGLYNPGWKCLDNSSTSVNVTGNSTITNLTFEYHMHTCEGFDSCANVEFNPEASTIVTEWGLICGKAWVPRLMISMFTAGSTLVCPIVGYAADKCGRKKTIHVLIFLQVIFNVVTVFSVSWQMFMTANILVGLTVYALPLSKLLMTEFVVPKWRIYVVSFPSWCLATTCFALFAMLTKSWKAIRIYLSMLSFIAFMFLFWVPESMRWLSVRGQDKKVKCVVGKIAKHNKTKSPEEGFMDKIIENDSKRQNITLSYMEMFNLFKKGYLLPTIVICVVLFTEELVYFAITFGTSALPGDIFENMVILAASELPGNALAIYFGNSIGRKKSLFIFLVVESLCLFGVAAFHVYANGYIKVYGILFMIIVAKSKLNVVYFIMSTATLEVYPTVIRSTLLGFIGLVINVGQLISPFVMPYDPQTLYINYLAMGGLVFLCSFLTCLLPETKGKNLGNTLDRIKPDVHSDIATKPINSPEDIY